MPTTDRAGRALHPLLSPKDEQAPTLAEAQQAGLLPTWAACADFVSSLPR